MLAHTLDRWRKAWAVRRRLNRIEEARIRRCEQTKKNGELHRTAGEVALVSPGHSAQAYFERALLVVRPQQARWWGLRAAMSMARALLAPIFGWFGEGFDAPVVKEAKALLDELAWYTASCL